jgi:type II secretory pathway pseudopilin PulG
MLDSVCRPFLFVRYNKIMKYRQHTSFGFTLGELLVVFAVVGVLSVIAFGSILTAREKARDGRRISDMKEIQLGLALYYDVNKAYPATLSTLTEVGQKYLPSIPVDPQNGNAYEYMTSGANARYCLGVTLENIIPNDNVSCTSAASGSTANYKASR